MFLCLIFWLCESQLLVQAIQFVLSVASCYLVFLAILPRGRAMALAGGLGMAASPWLAWRVGWVMSETYGVFLASVLTYYIAKFERSRSGWHSFLLGTLGVLLVLTTPGVIFLIAGVVGYISFKGYPRFRAFLACTAGCALVMVPWQVHCFIARGHLIPSIFSRNDELFTSFMYWPRAWTVTEVDMFDAYRFRTQRKLAAFDTDVPDSAFCSLEQRSRLRSLVDRFARGQLDSTELDREFRAVGMEMRDRDPLRYYVVLPLRRVWHLWGAMPDASHIQWKYVGRLSISTIRADWVEYGPLRAIIRSAKAIISPAGVVAHYIYLSGFLLIAICALRSRRAVPVVIVLGVLGYTCLCCVSGFGESRRNVPFYPFLFFLLFYWPDSCTSSIRGYWNRAIQRFTHYRIFRTWRNDPVPQR